MENNKTQTIWTVCPNGISQGQLELSIFISFRLVGAESLLLGDYAIHKPTPWPQLILNLAQNGGLSLDLNDSGLSYPLTIQSQKLDLECWNALFGDDTRVSPFQFEDNTKRRLYSYPVMEVEHFVDRLFTDVANTGIEEPAQAGVIPGGPAAPSEALTSASLDFSRLLNSGLLSTPNPSILPRQRTVGPNPDADVYRFSQLPVVSQIGQVPFKALYNAHRFFNRRTHIDANGNPVHQEKRNKPRPRVESPRLDFHQAIATLSDHPEILRKLGVIVDATIPTDRLDPQANWSGTLTVSIADTAMPPSVEVISTKVASVLDLATSAFHAESSQGNGPLGREFLDLSDENRFNIRQTDVDANSQRTINHLTSLDADKIYLGQFQRESMPSQRNAGLTLIQSGRDAATFARFKNQAEINNTLEGTLAERPSVFADDMQRGFRVDVLSGGQWRSLCARDVQYTLGEQRKVVNRSDEGHVKAASATSPTEPFDERDDFPPDLYLHESVFGWDNWSLVAQRPGRTISYKHEDDGTQSVAVQREESQFNQDFKFQALAKATPGTLPKLRFGEEYAFRARIVDLCGNSLSLQDAASRTEDGRTGSTTYRRFDPVPVPVLVMREPITLAESVEHLVVRSRMGDTFDIDGVDEASLFNQRCLRFIAAPKCTQHLAELHGQFDPFWNEPAKAYNLATRESGTFNEPGKAVIYEGSTPYPGGPGFPPNYTPGDFPPGYKRGDALPESSSGLHVYVVHPGPALELPYLPDPMSTGIVFQGLPGYEVTQAQWDFAGTQWPDAEPIALRMQAAAIDTQVQAERVGNELVLSVPPGEVLKVRYSSALDERVERLMAQFQKLTPENKAKVVARNYQHWMLAPWREISFVHAVERPVRPSSVTEILVKRQANQTFANIEWGLEVSHVSSTGKLDLLGTWDDWEDRLSDPIYTIEKGRTGSLGDLEVKLGDRADLATTNPGSIDVTRPSAVHEFGDTKHRVVTYSVVSHTRFREYFPERMYEQVQLMSRGDGETVSISVPSSQRPAPPELLYVIPTYRWETEGASSSRFGGGLRIYLDRPWFSSGQDEKLAVLFRQSSNQDKVVLASTSEIGADPGYEGDRAPRRLTASLLRKTPDTEFKVVNDVSLAEQTSAQVSVAVFDPKYDQERRLWYVDLEFDPKTLYTPFVRLSLARYQAESIDDLHLSTSVRAQFSQLQPDRTATLSRSSDGKTVTVTVSGNAPRHGASYSNGNPQSSPEPVDGKGRLVTVQIEESSRLNPGNLGWSSVTNESALDSRRSLSSAPDLLTWQSSVTVPAPTLASNPLRVVIREYEIMHTDPGLGESAARPHGFGNHVRRRLVYAEHIYLQ